jgi:uncharacterized protein (UPF0335 family)
MDDNTREYIKRQLIILKEKKTYAEQFSHLNAVYAVLESQGYSTREVRSLIDVIVLENIEVIVKELKEFKRNIDK